MTNTPTRMLLVDDHAVTRSGIRVMAELVDGVQVVGEGSTGVDAVRLCEGLRPDIVLMDIQMPEMDGIEATRVLRDRCPGVEVLVLTVHEDEDAVFEAIRAGAAGYLAKSCSADDLRDAVDAIRAGGTYMAPGVAGLAIRSITKRGERPHESARASDAMTDREREVLAHLAHGLSARAIAKELGISERTVNTHVGHVYRKLGVNNRVDAVLVGMRLGMVDAVD